MNKKVIMALSGGVDSSVAALILIEQGYDVIGVTMKNWEFESAGGNLTTESSCCSLGSIENARMVAAQLEIPHYVFDVSDFFHEKVIENFKSEYLSGNTPNPCVRCNSLVRWATLLEKEEVFDADFVATGHYARIHRSGSKSSAELRMGIDPDKDQTYALWGLKQSELEKTLFPLGGLSKPEVRLKAEKAKLRTSKTPESFEICFIPDNDYRRYIRDNIEGIEELAPEGDILDTEGNVLGIHQGFTNYTIGQRKGLGIALGEPAYVTEINSIDNTIRIGSKKDLMSTDFSLADVNIIDNSRDGEKFSANVKIRYHDKGNEAAVQKGSDGKWSVRFNNPVEAVTPGQSAVFYDADRLIGGGIISAKQ